jgi:glutamate N-acetyltransferase/amino-acid N-acetyltransferase
MKKQQPSKIASCKGSVTAARGFSASGVKAGIKISGALDLGLLVSDRPCAAAGCFTTNKVRASSVDRNAAHLPSGRISAVVCNSGNANACTGRRGEQDTCRVAELAAESLGTTAEAVLTASTGVIGHPLPVAKIQRAFNGLVSSLSPNKGEVFAQAIMTTDTKMKTCAVELKAPRGTYRIGGCCKGAGMISPKMATMLAFITTDIKIAPAALRQCVKRVVDRTFNNLTIDGDTSTNDMVLVLANGASAIAASSAKEIALFEEGLFAVCNTLCAKIAEDGEGATKRIEITIAGGKTYADAQAAARAIANSNLVKTAMFGNDPNWGRILCAIGYSGADFSRNGLRVSLCGIPVCKGTTPVPFPVAKMRSLLAKKVVSIDANLGLGSHRAIAHTCDFSYDYVKINAEYHT